MENIINNYIQQNSLITEKETIVVALSGGIDSMVLFDVLRKLGYPLVVAHVNHKVRPESDDELIFVQKYVSSFNVPFESLVLNEIANGNFHKESRLMRYEFFKQVAKKYNAKKIATAHHQDDLIETILMRLVRGSNLYGYGGIKSFIQYDDYALIRPLLCVSRKQISDYQMLNNIPFCEDSSNHEDHYTRNRFRHNIVPKLVQENEKAYQNISHFSSMLYTTFAYIRKQTTVLYEKNEGMIYVDEFKTLDPALQDDLISYCLEQKKIECNYQKLSLISSFILNNEPNGFLNLNQDLILLKNYNIVVIKEDKTIKDYEFQANLEDEIVLPNGNVVKITKNIINNEDIFLKLCYNDLRFPLTIRNRRDGDFFLFPYGKKKIKDLFIDMKIPMEERNSVPIIISDGMIMGIPGIIKGPKKVIDPLYIIYRKGNSK